MVTLAIGLEILPGMNLVHCFQLDLNGKILAVDLYF